MKFYLDENLRFIPDEPELVIKHIYKLREIIDSITSIGKKVNLIGEIGYYLTTLNQLDEARKVLEEVSNKMFSDLILECAENNKLSYFLPFAYQDHGKNLFDQKQYKYALLFFEKALDIRIANNSPEDQIVSTKEAIKKHK